MATKVMTCVCCGLEYEALVTNKGTAPTNGGRATRPRCHDCRMRCIPQTSLGVVHHRAIGPWPPTRPD